jgi:hypothetical protein
VTVYEVTAVKDNATMRREFPYLSEAFLFMTELHAEGWVVSDPVPVSNVSGWLNWHPIGVKTKEIA